MPTVVIGNNTGDDYSGTEDCHIYVNGADTNYGENVWLYLYPSSERVNVLLKFSGIDSLVDGITVSAASLYLYNNSLSNPSAFRRCLRNWTESGATYNTYDGTNAWTSVGAMSNGNDRVATASLTYQFPGTEGYISPGDLASDVNGMASGTYGNYGWVIEATGGESWMTFASKNNSDGYRPYLSVTYTESGGSGNSYYYQQQQM